MNADFGLYAYGLVGNPSPQLDILGIDKKNKVYPVAARELCVMVSNVDVEQFQQQVKDLLSELTKTPATMQAEAGGILQAHEAVIETLMQHTTVVPLKFGTILKNEDAVTKMLQENEEKFSNLLTKLADRVELGLKVYADRQALMNHLAQIGPRSSSSGKLSKGAAYLLGRKLEEEAKDQVAAQFAQAGEEIFQELGKEATAAKLSDTLSQKTTTKKKEMILNAAYLVEREKVAHFCQQGTRCMERYEFMEVELEFSGPWPPYNFVE